MSSLSERRFCHMGERCYHARFLNLEGPVQLSPSHQDAICDKCKRAGYTVEDAPPIVDNNKGVDYESLIPDSVICPQCGKRPAVSRLQTKPNRDLKPDDPLLSRNVPPDDIPMCEECSKRLVDERPDAPSLGVVSAL